jgi:hypothetical protein
MPFNDTTNKSGLIQDCEFWTNLGDAAISGDATLLKQFTRLLNIRLSTTFARLQILSANDGAEDRNFTSQQFSTFSIVSGRNDYEFLTDGDGNTISDITGVHIIPPTSSDYVALKRLSLSDTDAQLVMSPNTSNSGTPSGYIEKGSIVFFDKLPNFSGTGKLFYRLIPSYFLSSDTTKQPGIVDAGHRVLSLGASLDYVLVHKPENTALITRIEGNLAKTESLLEDYTRQKNPTRSQLIAAQHSSR